MYRMTPYGSQPIRGSFVPNYGTPQRQYQPSSPGVEVPLVGPTLHQAPWPPVPMRGQLPGQMPPNVPPPMPPRSFRREPAFTRPLPSPGGCSRRHSIHIPATSHPGFNRRFTFCDTGHNSMSKEEHTQKKVRERHGSSSGKKRREKEQAEKFKEKRRRCRDANNQNSSKKKTDERPQKDGSTTVNITIRPENQTKRRDEPGGGYGSSQRFSQRLRPRSRGRSLPDEEWPLRTSTPRPFSPQRNPLPPRAPLVPGPPAPPTPPQTPRPENPSPRAASVERDIPVGNPHPPKPPETSDPIQKVIDLLMEVNQKLQREDTVSTVRGGRTNPSSVDCSTRSRKTRPVFRSSCRRQPHTTSVLSSNDEGEDLWDSEDEEDDIYRGKSLGPKETRPLRHTSKMEQRMQNAKKHQRNTRLKLASKIPKSRLSSISRAKLQKDGEIDVGSIVEGLTCISCGARTTDDWDGESVLDEVRSGKYVIALMPARSFSSQEIPKYRSFHGPRVLTLPIG